MVAGAPCTCTAGCITILHASTQCIQVTIHGAINAAKLQLCVLKQNILIGCRPCTQKLDRRHVHNEHVHILGVCACQSKSAMGQGCCTAMLWHACSWNFTRVAVYLVVQMDLSRWRAVCGGQLTFRWSLNRWQRQSRLANHAITHEPSLKSKNLRW